MHEQIREDLKAGRIGLAQNRLPANCGHRGRCTRRISPTRPRHLTDKHRELGLAALEKRRGRRGHARRRSRLPLDPGRGRGQGAASVLQTRRPPPLVCRNPPREEPQNRQSLRHSPAPHLHHQLLLPRADPPLSSISTATSATRGRSFYPKGNPSACAPCPPCATCDSPGRKCPSKRSTSSNRKSATACAPRSSAGRKAPARPPITPTTCRSNASIPSAIGMRFPTCCATAPSPHCSKSARS